MDLFGPGIERCWVITWPDYIGPIAMIDEARAQEYREQGWTVVEVEPKQPRGAVDPEMPRVFFRDIEPEPGWEVRVIDPGEEVAIEPGTWVEYVPLERRDAKG